MKKLGLFLILGALVMFHSIPGADAVDPSWGGHAAVAVSPDGSLIAVGGTNRTLYVLDGSNYEVKKRIWLGPRIGEACFNGDGSTLVVEDDEEALHFFDTKTWKVKTTVSKAGFASFSPTADLLAAYRLGSNPQILFLSMTDGAQKGVVDLPGRIAGLGLDAAAKKLSVITEGVKSETEKKVGYNDIPKDLRGLAKEEFKQKNDGRTSRLLTFEVPSGKMLSEADLYFTTNLSHTMVLVHGGFTWIVTYSNVNAKLSDDGKTELFQCTSSYNYGRGHSLDRKHVLVGGLRNGTMLNLEGMQMVNYKIDRLPGWPEYFDGFTFDAEGKGYGVTSACRLVVLSPQGKIIRTIPVF